MYVQRQKDRIESVLDYLRPYLSDRGTKEWNFASMTLYAFLDWGLYRQMINIDARPECKKILEVHSQRPAVIATALPKV
jgi:hypothetical protein